MNSFGKMKKTVAGVFILLLCIVLSSRIQAQENHLDKRVSLGIADAALDEVIFALGEAGGFQFSYNALILPGSKLVSVNAEQEPVRSILLNLLGTEYRYKVIGNHVVILKEGEKQKQSKAERRLEYVIQGYIVDGRTGEKINQASVYELENRKVTATDPSGFYTLILPALDEDIYLSYSKVGYQDTIVLVRPKEDVELNISLQSLKRQGPTLEKVQAAHYDMHQSPFVAGLVPPKAIAMADNVQIVEERGLQVSLLPFVGSNHLVSGMLTNRLSVNLIAGYSAGVNGAELGGFLNMNRRDMKGIQLAGFGNIVGGEASGLQAAGFFNATWGKMSGIQLAGFTNVANDTIEGIQVSGFANVLRGRMNGSQIAGFMNFTSKDVDGVQVSGFANVSVKDVKMGQVSGFANYAHNVAGLQIAGFTNIASGTNRAFQVSGFLNYATDLHGVQLSVFNVADTVSAGVPIGLFSYVRKGLHQLEFSTEELFPVNLAFKTGINAFYNSFSAGYQTGLAYVGYGLGTQVFLTKKLGLGLEAHARALATTDGLFTFKGNQNQIKATINLRLARHFTLTAGPSFNLMLSTDGFPTTTDFLFPNLIPVTNTTQGSVQLNYWWGGSIGIRI